MPARSIQSNETAMNFLRLTASLTLATALAAATLSYANDPSPATGSSAQTYDPTRPAPALDAGKVDAQKTDAVKKDAIKIDAIKIDSLKGEGPKAESLKSESMKAESMKAESLKVDAPKADAPKTLQPTAPAPASLVPNITLPASIAAPRKRIGPTPVPSKTKSFFWEVKSLTNTVYLFGTIHVGKRAFYPLPEVVETAFDQSAKLVVEADVGNPSTTDELTALVSYVPPDRLDKNIPKPIYERLKTQLERLRIPEAAVVPMKPFVVGGFLSVVEFSRLGYDMNLGVDAYLLSRAKESGKPVEELESVRSQLEMLSKMPAHLQEAFLDNAISVLELNRSSEQVTGMVNAWQTGDARLMADVTAEINRGMRLTSQIDDILLHGRHDAMMKKIESYLAGKEAYFVAVGSLHLVGSRGLIQALQSKGYEVKQK